MNGPVLWTAGFRFLRQVLVTRDRRCDVHNSSFEDAPGRIDGDINKKMRSTEADSRNSRTWIMPNCTKDQGGQTDVYVLESVAVRDAIFIMVCMSGPTGEISHLAVIS
jgi:hypothetical protein